MTKKTRNRISMVWLNLLCLYCAFRILSRISLDWIDLIAFIMFILWVCFTFHLKVSYNFLRLFGGKK